MADKAKTEVITAGIDLIDLKQGKQGIKEQIEKRKESIDYFIEKRKRYEEAQKKANR